MSVAGFKSGKTRTSQSYLPCFRCSWVVRWGSHAWLFNQSLSKVMGNQFFFFILFLHQFRRETKVFTHTLSDRFVLQAKQVYRDSKGQQQVLPLDSIFRRSLPEWNRCTSSLFFYRLLTPGPVRFLRSLECSWRRKQLLLRLLLLRIGMFLRTVGYWGLCRYQAQVVLRVVTAIHRINLYPADKLLP